MSLIESVSGFQDLFSDPPEFGILYARKTQQYSNYVRLLLGVLAFILLAKQTTESPIQCLHVMNSTIRI